MSHTARSQRIIGCADAAISMPRAIISAMWRGCNSLRPTSEHAKTDRELRSRFKKLSRPCVASMTKLIEAGWTEKDAEKPYALLLTGTLADNRVFRQVVLVPYRLRNNRKDNRGFRLAMAAVAPDPDEHEGIVAIENTGWGLADFGFHPWARLGLTSAEAQRGEEGLKAAAALEARDGGLTFDDADQVADAYDSYAYWKSPGGGHPPIWKKSYGQDGTPRRDTAEDARALHESDAAVWAEVSDEPEPKPKTAAAKPAGSEDASPLDG